MSSTECNPSIISSLVGSTPAPSAPAPSIPEREVSPTDPSKAAPGTGVSFLSASAASSSTRRYALAALRSDCASVSRTASNSSRYFRMSSAPSARTLVAFSTSARVHGGLRDFGWYAASYRSLQQGGAGHDFLVLDFHHVRRGHGESPPGCCRTRRKERAIIVGEIPSHLTTGNWNVDYRPSGRHLDDASTPPPISPTRGFVDHKAELPSIAGQFGFRCS